MAAVAEVRLRSRVRGVVLQKVLTMLQEILAREGNLPAVWLSLDRCFEHRPYVTCGPKLWGSLEPFRTSCGSNPMVLECKGRRWLTVSHRRLAQIRNITGVLWWWPCSLELEATGERDAFARTRKRYLLGPSRHVDRARAGHER